MTPTLEKQNAFNPFPPIPSSLLISLSQLTICYLYWNTCLMSIASYKYWWLIIIWLDKGCNFSGIMRRNFIKVFAINVEWLVITGGLRKFFFFGGWKTDKIDTNLWGFENSALEFFFFFFCIHFGKTTLNK